MASKMANIQTIQFSAFGKLETLTNVGEGNYPYECGASKKFPESVIFQNDMGGWVASHELFEIEPGIFTTDFFKAAQDR